MDQSSSQVLGLLGLSGRCFPPKLPPSPSNTLFFGPRPLIIPNGISIDLAVLLRVSNAMVYNVLSVGKKALKIALFP